MADELPRLIEKPTELMVGDTVSGILVGAGMKRGIITVTGVFTTDEVGQGEVAALFCIGTLKEDVKTYEGIASAGSGVGIWNPRDGGSALEQDRKAIANGDVVRYYPVLMMRGASEVADNEEAPADERAEILAAIRRLTGESLGDSDKVVTLQNPLPLRVYGNDSYECGECDGQARYYYPKVGEFRCPLHRDRSLQSKDDPPRKWETYLAYESDPMDAKHFVTDDDGF